MFLSFLRKTKFLLGVFLISAFIAKADDGRLYYDQVFAPAEGYISKIEKAQRKEICLNGKWDFQAIELPGNYSQGAGVAPELPFPDDKKWDNVKIKIPSPWNINAFANRNLQGPDHRNFPSYPKAWEDVKMAWMRKSVVIPSDWNNEKIMLHFEAVAGFTEVYVNGEKAGENFDLFLPFQVDISTFVHPGKDTEILVGVRSQRLFEDNSTKGRRIVPAGSMWGYDINGIWQDVYLIAVPKIHISDVFVKPQVSKGSLDLDITIENTTSKEEVLSLSGDIREWINRAGTDVHSAPVPNWDLASNISLNIPEEKIKTKPGITVVTIQIPVKEGSLHYWTPEFPNLYGLTLNLKSGKKIRDTKYERFGWREWTISGTKHLLNGKEIQLKGDSWHFMGVPQMTRRYAWAWFKALKDANANAVRPHAQVYPKFYMDVADEMGICVLAETANWASDGGPKLDSPLFWENSKEHLRRMVLRDRNHASVFGWSISNENKPVILHVFNKPEWMPMQKQAWADWRDIVRENDPTRPWITSDGEDDGDGLLPATMGHYGDRSSMKHWIEIGKPWGIGEHSMAYYGTPEQVSKYNGERAYESMLGRMEGLAYECYDLIAEQRNNGASYVSVFNIAWYGLQPLPFGKRDLTSPPKLDDGIHFRGYTEGQPGIQPERIGPYCSTFNPGYDPTLPLYKPWPMFDAIKVANAGDKPQWSKWASLPKKKLPSLGKRKKSYNEVFFVGNTTGDLHELFRNHGIVYSSKLKDFKNSLLIIDGSYSPNSTELNTIKNYITKGVDVWLWSPTPATLPVYQEILPEGLFLEKRSASSFIPEKKSWMYNLVNSDFYFSEIQNNEACEYGLSGRLVSEGEILLNACNTNWRKWNKQGEELKTASILRSENEEKGSNAVFIKYSANNGSTFFISTINNFTSTEKGYNTLDKIISGAGIPAGGKSISESLIDKNGFVEIKNLFMTEQDNRKIYSFWIYSPRPLDDLLIEPNMPKLDIIRNNKEEIGLNGEKLESLKAIPLKQGWNQIRISVPQKTKVSKIQFVCENNSDFVKQLQTSLQNPNRHSE